MTVMRNISGLEEGIESGPLRANLLLSFRISECRAAHPEQALQGGRKLDGVQSRVAFGRGEQLQVVRGGPA